MREDEKQLIDEKRREIKRIKGERQSKVRRIKEKKLSKDKGTQQKRGQIKREEKTRGDKCESDLAFCQST